jgi:DNA-binding XRE family transcriptional regulator
MTKLAVVYRCYSANDELLYIGVTTQPLRRVRLHARQTSWWSSVQRMEYDAPLPLDLARQSEREQIHRLAPPHNKTVWRATPRFVSFADPEFRHVGRNIRRARGERGHTQDSIARALGITVRAVGQWEVGKTVPSRRHLEELAALLERQPEWFYRVGNAESVAA